jgi:hypothetical protein
MYVMVIVLAVTPRDVAPPFDPVKVVQGGEYGSPATCGPLQVPVPAPAAGVPPAATVPLVTPDVGVPGTVVPVVVGRVVPVVLGSVVAVVPDAAPELVELDADETFCSGAMLGMKRAMAKNPAMMSTAGP